MVIVRADFIAGAAEIIMVVRLNIGLDLCLSAASEGPKIAAPPCSVLL